MSEHPYIERYHAVWQNTLISGELPEELLEKSRYYVESDLANPVPKEFD